MVDGLGQMISGQRIGKRARRPDQDRADRRAAGAASARCRSSSCSRCFSINLGFINLLPVPMLDGGHLFFYAVEAVRRRPVSAQALEWAFRGGLALILALLVFTTINDLGSLGLWDRLERLIG